MLHRPSIIVHIPAPANHLKQPNALSTVEEKADTSPLLETNHMIE
jgi:hypothetical protein